MCGHLGISNPTLKRNMKTNSKLSCMKLYDLHTSINVYIWYVFLSVDWLGSSTVGCFEIYNPLWDLSDLNQHPEWSFAEDYHLNINMSRRWWIAGDGLGISHVLQQFFSSPDFQVFEGLHQMVPQTWRYDWSLENGPTVWTFSRHCFYICNLRVHGVHSLYAHHPAEIGQMATTSPLEGIPTKRPNEKTSKITKNHHGKGLRTQLVAEWLMDETETKSQDWAIWLFEHAWSKVIRQT